MKRLLFLFIPLMFFFSCEEEENNNDNTITFTCTDSGCYSVEDGSGQYATLDDCMVCFNNIFSYNCEVNGCVELAGGLGEYATLEQCIKDCTETNLSGTWIRRPKYLSSGSLDVNYTDADSDHEDCCWNGNGSFFDCNEVTTVNKEIIFNKNPNGYHSFSSYEGPFFGNYPPSGLRCEPLNDQTFPPIPCEFQSNPQGETFMIYSYSNEQGGWWLDGNDKLVMSIPSLGLENVFYEFTYYDNFLTLRRICDEKVFFFDKE